MRGKHPGHRGCPSFPKSLPPSVMPTVGDCLLWDLASSTPSCPSTLAYLGLLIHISMAAPAVLPPPKELAATPRGHKRQMRPPAVLVLLITVVGGFTRVVSHLELRGGGHGFLF